MGGVRMVEMTGMMSRLRELHAADRAALEGWLRAAEALARATARFERARLEAPGQRRRTLSGAGGLPRPGGAVVGSGEGGTYPLCVAARDKLIRRHRAQADLVALGARRACVLEAERAGMRGAKARLAAVSRMLRAQVPWVDSMTGHSG